MFPTKSQGEVSFVLRDGRLNVSLMIACKNDKYYIGAVLGSGMTSHRIASSRDRSGTEMEENFESKGQMWIGCK